MRGALWAVARVVPVTGDYLHFNRIIGGLRFRQQADQIQSVNRRGYGAGVRQITPGTRTPPLESLDTPEVVAYAEPAISHTTPQVAFRRQTQAVLEPQSP